MKTKTAIILIPEWEHSVTCITSLAQIHEQFDSEKHPRLKIAEEILQHSIHQPHIFVVGCANWYVFSARVIPRITQAELQDTQYIISCSADEVDYFRRWPVYRYDILAAPAHSDDHKRFNKPADSMHHIIAASSCPTIKNYRDPVLAYAKEHNLTREEAFKALYECNWHTPVQSWEDKSDPVQDFCCLCKKPIDRKASDTMMCHPNQSRKGTPVHLLCHTNKDTHPQGMEIVESPADIRIEVPTYIGIDWSKDYIQEYADKNNLTKEEAFKALYECTWGWSKQITLPPHEFNKFHESLKNPKPPTDHPRKAFASLQKPEDAEVITSHKTPTQPVSKYTEKTTDIFPQKILEGFLILIGAAIWFWIDHV